MPHYLSPGVYVEEVEAGSRPIEGVGTAVAAFVGLAAAGPPTRRRLVTNWSQFTPDVRRLHRGLVPRARRLRLLPQRRRRGYVVRVGADGAMPTRPRGARRAPRTRPSPAYRVAALEAGPAGNDITIDVQPPEETAESSFKLVVNQGGKPSRTSTT